MLEAANQCYLEFLSGIEDPRNGRDRLDSLSVGASALRLSLYKGVPRLSYRPFQRDIH